MEIKILENLKQIIEREVQKCNDNKTVPSRELLDTIHMFYVLSNLN